MKHGNTRPFLLPLTTVATAYEANDLVGSLQTIDALGPSGRGVLKHVTITDLDNQKAAMTLVFFSDLPVATFTEESAFPNLSAADLAKVIGKVEIAAADYTTLNARAVATKECSICLWSNKQTGAGSQDKRTVYCALMTSGTPTYTATTSLNLVLGTLLD